MGIYDDDKLLESAERKIREADYPSTTKDAILDFENHLFLDGISIGGVRAYISQLHMYAIWLNDIPLPNASVSDIKRFIG